MSRQPPGQLHRRRGLWQLLFFAILHTLIASAESHSRLDPTVEDELVQGSDGSPQQLSNADISSGLDGHPQLEIQQEQGLFALTSRHLDVNLLQSYLGRNFLLLVLVYDEGCPACHLMLQRMTEASMIYQAAMDNLDYNGKATASFAKIMVHDLKQEWVSAIDSVPALLFLTATAGGDHEANNDPSTLVLLEYSGLSNRARDIADTVLHYSWRLQTLSQQVRMGQDMLLQEFPRLEHLDQVHGFVSSQRDMILRLLDKDSVYQNALVQTGLTATGEWNSLDTQYIQWLLTSDALEPEDVKVFVQCRRHSESDELVRAFERFARVASNKRDCLFLSANDCPDHDVDVVLYSIPLQELAHHDWTLPHPTNLSARSAERLAQLLLQFSTPSVMGFDRQLTAPLACPLFRKVHAILFIDIHNIPDDTKEWNHERHMSQREALASFQRVCRNQRREMMRDVGRDLVCLIVPSSETRVLMSLGIDIWSPFDQELFGAVAENGSSLPALVVTDQRFGGTRRYSLVGDMTERAMASFIINLWTGNLSPERLIDARGPRTNKAGVRIVTADTVYREIFQEVMPDRHGLIVFTSSTCGHCKRFNTLFNQLSELLHHLGWNDRLSLYEMDVTKNDLLDLNVTVRWLPDLYYISPGDTTLVPYETTDAQGDGVGALNDALEILDWFLDVSAMPESQIQRLLVELQSIQ